MKQIKRLKIWFEHLSLRERVFFTLMIWAIIYALFSLLLFRPLDNYQSVYLAQIKKSNEEIKNLELQIHAVDQIAESPLYQQWKKQHLIYEKIQGNYKSLIGDFSQDNWRKVLKTIIFNHPNITITHIGSSEEKQLAPENKLGFPIYQKMLTLVIYGDYINTIKNLQYIEEALPNIHWDSLTYEVINYPTAKTTMEFSVFYDKENK